jgi:hypothetical protein
MKSSMMFCDMISEILPDTVDGCHDKAKNALVIENFGTEPVRLTRVRQSK